MGTLQLSDMWNGLRDCSRMTFGGELRSFGRFDRGVTPPLPTRVSTEFPMLCVLKVTVA
jgi:hypothetical protein